MEKELREERIRFISSDVANQPSNKESMPKKDLKQERYKNGYEDVKDLFVQQTSIIRDRYKIRWVKCEKCCAIKQDVEFASYGGENHVNLGLCTECGKKPK